MVDVVRAASITDIKPAILNPNTIHRIGYPEGRQYYDNIVNNHNSSLQHNLNGSAQQQQMSSIQPIDTKVSSSQPFHVATITTAGDNTAKHFDGFGRNTAGFTRNQTSLITAYSQPQRRVNDPPSSPKASGFPQEQRRWSGTSS